MNKLYKFRFSIALGIVLLNAVFPVFMGSGPKESTTKMFNIRARQYSYDPPVINVQKGDTVHLKLSTLDVVHGFYLEGHGIDANIFPTAPFIRMRDDSQPDGFRPVEEIVFVADKVGKFRYRCSHNCGPLHPFMQGELLVGPNYPYQAAIGAAIGVFLAGCFLLVLKVRHSTKNGTE